MFHNSCTTTPIQKAGTVPSVNPILWLKNESFYRKTDLIYRNSSFLNKFPHLVKFITVNSKFLFTCIRGSGTRVKKTF